jgi:hypothetical protein
MRSVVPIAVSAILGGVVGSIIASQVTRLSMFGRIEAHEIVLVDENNRPTARLGPGQDGEVTLSFLGSDSRPQVTLGMESDASFLTFFDANGSAVMHLNSQPPIVGVNSQAPNSASTLYLGDSSYALRVTLGAHWGDEIGMPPESWGLTMVAPKGQTASVLLRKEH